jgi:competence protein ComEC
MAPNDRRPQGVAGTWPPRGNAQAGGFVPAGVPLWGAFAERLRAWARAEAATGRLLPWVPVAFGTGIALYFTAPREPVLSVTIATAIAFCIVAFLARRGRFFVAAVMAAAVASGFAIATWKTARVAHAVLARPLYSVSLSGFVETRDIREHTDRFVLRVTQMDAPRLATKLERVRLSVKKGPRPTSAASSS